MGEEVRVMSALPEKSEFTPDTSLASIDDNDLTEEYDKFAGNDPVDNLSSIEVHTCVCLSVVLLRLRHGNGNVGIV